MKSRGLYIQESHAEIVGQFRDEPGVSLGRHGIWSYFLFKTDITSMSTGWKCKLTCNLKESRPQSIVNCKLNKGKIH